MGEEEEEEEVITEEDEESKAVVRSRPGSLGCPIALGCTVLICLAAAVIVFLIMPRSASRLSAGALHGESGGEGGGGGGDASGGGATNKRGQSASAGTTRTATTRAPGKPTTAAPYAEYEKTSQTTSAQAAARGKLTTTARPATIPSVKTTRGVRVRTTKSALRATVTEIITATAQDHNGTTTITAADKEDTATKQTTMVARATIKTMVTNNRKAPKRTTRKKTTPTRPTTTTTTAMPYNSLICTLGADMTLSTVFELPEDGLCDFSFYQTVEDKHAALKGPGGPYAATFNLVLQAASEHAKTEYGLSFDYDFRENTHKLLKDRATRKVLNELWSKKIYHYAFMTLRFFDLNKEKYRRVFHILQKVKDILHGSRVLKRPSYFIVGESFSKDAWLYYAFNNIRERMHIAAAVIYGHLTYDDRGNGVVMPPTFWNSTKINQTMYEFNLDSSHAALKHMASRSLGYTQLFLSVTLAGRFYKPRREVGMLKDNGYVTNDPLFVSITQVCNDTDYAWGFHNTTPIGAYYENVKAGRIITYDDATSLRDKLCRGKQLIPKVKYGLAAYHAHLDDPANTCGEGAYPRLRFLRKLLHFFNEKFLEASDYDECIML